MRVPNFRYPLLAGMSALTLLAAVPSLELDAQPPASEVRWDNDAFRFPRSWSESDFGYTNGMRFTTSHATPGWLSRHIPGRYQRSCAYTPRGCNVFNLYGGQDIYTPRNQWSPDVVTGDRPYAGLLHGGGSITLAGHNQSASLGLRAGITGAASLAATLHSAIHRIDAFKTRPAKGWRHQLPTELVVNADYEHKRGLGDLSVRGLRVVSLAGNLGASAGTIETAASGGLTVHAGFAVPRAWNAGGDAASAVRPDGNGMTSARPTRSLYFIGGVGCRVIGRNLSLDGTTFADSHSVPKRNSVATYQLGVGARYSSVGIAYRIVTTGKEFDRGPNLSRFGAVTFAIYPRP